MASLRFPQRAVGTELSSSCRCEGARTHASARPSVPSSLLCNRHQEHQHCRRRRVVITSSRATPTSSSSLSSSSGTESATSSASSSRSSSSSATSLTPPPPVLRPPKGDIKPAGYSVADWAAAFESQLQEFDYDIEVKGARGGAGKEGGGSSSSSGSSSNKVAYNNDVNGNGNAISFVDGEIPAALRGGTLYRNGPARFERGGERYAHMLDGDGYVCRFEFAGDGSKVAFLSRFVKTRELVAEEYAGRILFRSTFGTQRAGGNPFHNAFDFRLKNPANTHVFPWGGKLLALWEAGPPYELDPRTLETRPAPATLGGLVTPGSAPSTTGVSRELDRKLGFGSALTAHPHVVPAPPGEADVWYGLKGDEEEAEEEAEAEVDVGGGGGGGGGGGLSSTSSAASTATSASPSSKPPYLSSKSSPSSSSPSPSRRYPSPSSRLATWAWQSQMTHRGPVLSIDVAEFDARWRRVSKARLSLPGASFNPHDFAVSSRHYTFFQNHTTFSMLPYVFGLKGPAQCVKVGLGELVAHVAPRGQSHPQHSPAQVSIRADEGGFLIHHAACFEDEKTGEIVVWSSGWAPEELKRLADAASAAVASSEASLETTTTGDDEGEGGGGGNDDGDDGGATASLGRRLALLARRFSSSSSSSRSSPSSSFSSSQKSSDSSSSSNSNRSTSDDSMLGSWKVVLNGDFDGIPHSTLQEHRVDLDKKKITRRTLFDDQAMEHPKINPLFATREPRFVYFTAARSLVPGKAAPPQAIVKLDAKTGEVETWAPGRRCFCEEIVFVPDDASAPAAAEKKGSGGGGDDGDEDAGFLLSMVFDASVGKSSLVVLDARSLKKGPVARVWLSHHVPHGLHGEWCAPGAAGF